MKYMKLGSRPDTFYTEAATRSVSSDLPSDLTIEINNTKYLLHKFFLVSKCGLMQRICDDIEDFGNTSVELHEIPGGEEAFELCAKFCYGIMINISAHNCVPAICAAKFLQMTESVEKGNFVLRLEAFFSSCILQGWKDSVFALQTTAKLPECSENAGIVGRCVDSIVEKILTQPSKVRWSFTYTRVGYAPGSHRSAPRDWWTEDISALDIDIFRCIIAAVRSSGVLPSALIGEALHVYASRWLSDDPPSPPKGRRRIAETSAAAQSEDTEEQQCRLLESIVSMLPTERDSVAGRFLLRLLRAACRIGVSPTTKAELVRRSGRQLDEAAVSDLLIPLRPAPASPAAANGHHFYDIGLVGALVENYLVQFRRRHGGGHGGREGRSDPIDPSMTRVSKLIDGYLQVVAADANMPVAKVVALAESLPGSVRQEHDELYKAIDIYLKEHPNLSKAEKKRLCRILDCRKLSKEMCMQALRNEDLPLRTLVQVLFIEQERCASRFDATEESRKIEHSSAVAMEAPKSQASTNTQTMNPVVESSNTGKEATGAESSAGNRRPPMSRRKWKSEGIHTEKGKLIPKKKE